MTENPLPLPAFFHRSAIGDDDFVYESPFSWEDLPYLRFTDLVKVRFPPTQRLRTGTNGLAIDFPTYDFTVQHPDKPPILFSGAHNRLLYEGLKGMFNPFVERRLIYLDHHDDFHLGSIKDFRDIHIGNWVSHGSRLGFWDSAVHVNQEYGRIENIYREETFPFHKIPLKDEPTCRDSFAELTNEPFFLSIDADGFAGSGQSFGRKEKNLLRIYLEIALKSENLELLHFTPSPAYCPTGEANKVWDAFREVVSACG